MPVIQKNIRLAGSRGSSEEVALFDSGASYSCISPELARKLEIVIPLPEPMSFGTAKDGEQPVATERVSVNFYIGGYRFSDEFMLIPDLSERVIIGAKTLQAWRMKLDFPQRGSPKESFGPSEEHDEVIIDPRVTKLRLM